MGGLLVATVLTLVFLPTVYVTWFGWRQSVSDRSKALAESPV
jgi:Cu/Ag efflux pump CusA